MVLRFLWSWFWGWLSSLTVELEFKLLDEEIASFLDVEGGACVRDPVEVEVAAVADLVADQVPEAVGVFVHAHGVEAVFVGVELERVT